jgi:tRNA U34 2-thiouridine synthase MnmA/TrmU
MYKNRPWYVAYKDIKKGTMTHCRTRSYLQIARYLQKIALWNKIEE